MSNTLVSPPTSPISSGPSGYRSQSYRSNTNNSAGSTYNEQSNPFSSANAPTSPTASTISGSGSPRSFYTPALGSLSDTASTIHGGTYSDMEELDTTHNGYPMEDDIGERTIIVTEPTPQKRKLSPVRSKGREADARSGMMYHAPSGSIDSNTGGSALDEPEGDDSKRVEETLRRWAEKEKLRRAKTRSRQSTQLASPPPAPIITDGIAAVSGLARRMSGAKRGDSANSRISRKNSKRISGSDGPFQESEAEEVELQIQIPTSTQSPTQLSPEPPSSASTISPLSPPPPLSTASTIFPHRVERAVRTGSRFIEDLEDQEMLSSSTMTNGDASAKTYADLQQSSRNPFATPLSSPTKQSANNPLTGKAKGRMRLGGEHRVNSFASISSFRTFDSKDTVTGPLQQAYPRLGLTSPTGSTGQPGVPFGEDDAHLRLFGSPRESREYLSGRHDEEEYQQYRQRERRQVSWWEYILCCGCCGNGVQLDDDDEQAGRTFPE